MGISNCLIINITVKPQFTAVIGGRKTRSKSESEVNQGIVYIVFIDLKLEKPSQLNLWLTN